MNNGNPWYFFHGDVIIESTQVKYLGHIISNELSDDCDIMRQRRQLYMQGNELSRRFHMCSVGVKNELFRSLCTNMYITTVVELPTAQSMRKLHVAYNNAFIMLHGLPMYCSASGMFTASRVPMLPCCH